MFNFLNTTMHSSHSHCVTTTSNYGFYFLVKTFTQFVSHGMKFSIAMSCSKLTKPFRHNNFCEAKDVSKKTG